MGIDYKSRLMFKIIDDTKMSYKSKGIFSYIFSKQIGQQLTMKSLIETSKDCESSIRAGLRELETAEYIIQTAVKKNGRVTDRIVRINDNPNLFTSFFGEEL